ncbi:MAG: hypothetical protein HS119_11825 [Flavobacteriales bacterium]|nr:hypothetical protein [Flavobacteriales bacterium]
MYRITDEQIDFILDNIRANGIVIEDLQNNLLDHICCIVENEMTEGEDFYKFYERIVPRFFKKELKEIEEETTNLLTFKNYYAMKNTVKISGTISGILILLGAIFKTMHWPGAGIMIVLGGLFFSLVFLPLMIVLKFKDDESKTDKWVFAFGFLMAMGAATGIVFKVMHWPYANFLMRWSVTFFLFGYIPLYYFTRIRRAELKFNTTINTVLMMACGGMMYALFNLHPSTGLLGSINASYDFMNNNSTELVKANTTLFTKLSDKQEVKEFHQTSTQLFNKIADIKAHLIAKTDVIPIEKAKNLSLNELQSGNDNSMIRRIFENGTGEYSLAKLKSEIEVYNNKVKMLFPNQQEKIIAIEKLQLENTILSVLLQELSQIQLQIATTENSYLSSVKE